jgi:hypothetical protein
MAGPFLFLVSRLGILDTAGVPRRLTNMGLGRSPRAGHNEA